ncbi:hypothetical protein ACFSAG_09525 [Sphingorhabdus buctiana]|uniref:ATP-binding protein n=1 Tax=Sphingorhabdus buctiana TaxID=1508805 RepID=A0ABW4MF33_9SPHN
MALDFARIRSGVDGQRGAFEALVRQLGRLNPPARATEFRHINGAGGDGGIEAFWLHSGDREYGYQAKYHLRPREIDWQALDGSILTALQTHPRLTHIQVAMPCDLTAQRTTAKGTSGWQLWDSHRSKWEASATQLGLHITFGFWGASEIEQMLASPGAAGLQEYWFGDASFSQPWFETQFARTVSQLDDRFHPEDHVEVSTRSIFDALRRTTEWSGRIMDRANKLRESRVGKVETAIAGTLKRDFEVLAEHLTIFEDIEIDLSAPADQTFPSSKWLEHVKIARDLIYKLSEAVWDTGSVNLSGNQSEIPMLPKEKRDALRRSLYQLREAIDDLDYALSASTHEAEQKKCAIILGRAGTGKSHLLASEVGRALAAKEPAVILLGTDFVGTELPEIQILKRLGLGNLSVPQFLGALQTKAEHRQSRCLIVIDALNEGAGGAVWRERLSGFVDLVLQYSRLALCVSCRSEYADFVLTDAAKRKSITTEVMGFATVEEQERAAQIYMDRRGILRPPTPWLSPEFSNPLFLRTTCIALEKENQKEFPKGLRGTRHLLSFYLSTAARHLGTSYDGSNDLIAPLKTAMLGMAQAMATRRIDFLERAQAAQIIDLAFSTFPAQSRAWIDILRSRSLLRFDINPDIDPSKLDPMEPVEEVVRFGFQRFQDHLVAQGLLEGVDQPTGHFSAGGPLSFMLGAHGVDWRWNGVFQALTIEFADRWRVEIVDELPGGTAKWWDDYYVQDAFVESARWRQCESFSDRSIELLNVLPRNHEQKIDLLLELALVTEHPWNAKMLHNNLAAKKMPQRDAWWTLAINESEWDEPRPSERIVRWALGPAVSRCSNDCLSLALVAVGWLFTSTNSRLRDRATKAVTHILLHSSELFPEMLKRFKDIDDVYVLERVLAAAAGACLRDPDPDRLKIYAQSVYLAIFARPKVTPHILLRDYARLIIDMAEQKGALPKGIDPLLCRPPYKSALPRFGLAEDKVQARANKVGDRSIMSSCVGFVGDFGRYVVESHTRDLTLQPLKGAKPLRPDEAIGKFKEDFIVGNASNEDWMKLVEQAYVLRRPEEKAGDEDTEGLIPQLESYLFLGLTKDQQRRYETEIRPALEHRNEWILPNGNVLARPDPRQLRLWVAYRALSMGWTEKLFPRDAGGGHSRHRSHKIERIGKKYQWIAYHELLARMADNYWLVEKWGSKSAKVYDNPLDLEYNRDIDPTTPPVSEEVDLPLPDGMSAPKKLKIEHVEPDDMVAWVEDANLISGSLSLALCHDVDDADDWIALYRSGSVSTKYDDKLTFTGAPFRQDEFHYLQMVAIEKRARAGFVKSIEAAGIDFHEWLPPDFTDGPYLYEAGLRNTWPTSKWAVEHQWKGPEFRFVRCSYGYHWEHHLDGSMPNGFQFHVPHPWLFAALNIRPDPINLGRYFNTSGELVVISGGGDRAYYCLVRKSKILPVLANEGLDPVWVGFGERTGWPDPKANEGPRKRWNGCLWLSKAGVKTTSWFERA